MKVLAKASLQSFPFGDRLMCRHQKNRRGRGGGACFMLPIHRRPEPSAEYSSACHLNIFTLLAWPPSTKAYQLGAQWQRALLQAAGEPSEAVRV